MSDTTLEQVGPRAQRGSAGRRLPWVRNGRRRKNQMLRRESTTGLIFVLPAVVLFAIFGAYTVGYGFLLSFARWNGLSPSWDWVGLQNFKDLFATDPSVAPVVHEALWVTVVVMIVLPMAVVAISFPLAVLLNSISRFRAVFRTIFFLPYVTAGIAVFYAWRFMYEPNGVVNGFLGAIGLDGLTQPDGFLGNQHTALAACIVVLVWANVPLAILLFLAGLQSVPAALVEAAKIDGASTVRTLRSVVLPMVNPITALIVVIELREALQNFQLFLLLTNGGPIGSTNTIGLQSYTFAFGSNSNLGFASALSWSLTAIALVLAGLSFRLMRDRT
ncbi:carbohydrate ABC transporter permease [Aeromicrobium sp. P5_D10]